MTQTPGLGAGGGQLGLGVTTEMPCGLWRLCQASRWKRVRLGARERVFTALCLVPRSPHPPALTGTPSPQTGGARGCAPASRSGSMRSLGSTWRISGSSPRRAPWRRRSPSVPGGGGPHGGGGQPPGGVQSPHGGFGARPASEHRSGCCQGCSRAWLCHLPDGDASLGRRGQPEVGGLYAGWHCRLSLPLSALTCAL